MKYMRAMMLGAALLGGSSLLATAQMLVPVQYPDERQAFQDGYRQGQWDARHGRPANSENNNWRGDDRRAYRDGYERGYREVRVDGFRPQSFNGSGSYGYAQDAPRKFGYQDGYSDGLHDRRTGHSFRPTHDDNYHHADRGYYPGFGSKSYYKDMYRQAYEQGYRQGFENGWRY